MIQRLFKHLPGFRRVALPKLSSGGDLIGLLADGDSASISYLIEPHLSALGRPVVYLPARAGKVDAIEATVHTVVIVRYLPSAWLAALHSFRAAGGKVVYFMDDDLMDPQVATDLPAAYARKIREQATRQRKHIEALCGEFWVGSAYLAQKYPAWKARVLQPLASLETLAQKHPVTVCYHGTASHRAEHGWLPHVLSHVQQACQEVMFEVFGDHSVNRLFRDLPHVAVLHPMSWPSYLAYTSAVKRDIGLAPLLPGLFNAARGPTKFFDFARMGAVGIYSDVAPYRDFVRHDIDGLLLPNDPSVWAQAIVQLANDPARRQRMATSARERALAMATQDSAKKTRNSV